jgi:RND family efflux transporter MFP subunit
MTFPLKPKQSGRRFPFFLGNDLTGSHFLTQGLKCLLLAPLGVGFLFLSGILGRGTAEEPGPERAPLLPVRVAPVEVRSAFEASRSFVGRVEAARGSRLGFERGGLLVEVLVDSGDVVEAGQVLASLDGLALESRRAEVEARRAKATSELNEMLAGPRSEVIAAARAEVRQREALRDLAKLTSARVSNLQRRGASTAQEFDEARFAELAEESRLRSAEARLEELLAGTRAEQIEAQRALVRQLEAEVRSIEIDLEKSKLVAPFGGTIAERFLDEGVVLGAGEPVVRLLETTKLDVQVGIASDEADRIIKGQEHRLTIRGREHLAQVRAVRPDRGDRTRTVSVLLRLEPSGEVRPGDLATIRLPRKVEEVGAWVPTTALTEGTRGLWNCSVAVEGPSSHPGASHVVERRAVEVVHLDTDRAFVRGTLSDGELVIVDGLQRLVPGQGVVLAALESIEEGVQE